jgi:Beta propeller domain
MRVRHTLAHATRAGRAAAGGGKTWRSLQVREKTQASRGLVRVVHPPGRTEPTEEDRMLSTLVRTTRARCTPRLVCGAWLLLSVGCVNGEKPVVASEEPLPPPDGGVATRPPAANTAAGASGGGAAGSGTTTPRSPEPDPKPDAGGGDEPAVKLYALERVDDCAEAEREAREHALKHMNDQLDEGLAAALKGGGTLCDAAAGLPTASAPPSPAPSAPSDPSNEASSDGADSTSMTNNQVAGVDEADFIKNDDKYVYAVLNGALRIVEAWPAASARELARVPLEGTPKKLFVLNDRALVYVSIPREQASAADEAFAGPSYVSNSECTYGYDCELGGDGTATAILVFDITDRAQPKQLRRLDLSGSLLAARRIGPAVHTVVVTPEVMFPGVSYYASVGGCGRPAPQAELEKAYAELRAKNTQIIQETELGGFIPSVREGDTEYADADCSAVYRETEPSGSGFTTLVSLDMLADGEPSIATVVSKPGTIYASGEALYMAVSRVPEPYVSARASVVHKFDLGEPASDKPTAYVASGEIEGRVLNQFALDEHDGRLRVASTNGRVPEPDTHSIMSVLEEHDGTLQVVGKIDDIAPSEDIRSVRFDGDRGFVVTFKKTDPLYAFDLSKPTEPKIVGELKIPGFSTYMHMLDDKHLLTIGYDADDQGSFAYFDGVLLQIFDVSDPMAPALAHKVVIGTRGSSSEALTNHLAFTLFDGKLAVPMTVCEGGGDGQQGTDLTFSGLIVYDVSVEQGFHERGRVAHPNNGTEYDDATCGNWWTNANSAVERSIFMDNFIYSVARDVMRVQNLDAMGTDVAAVPFTP